jgi:protein-S-isoprenylcysteine O-methyltransferase Ste14
MSLLPSSATEIGPSPAASVLALVTLGVLLLGDLVAVRLASGGGQLVPRATDQDRGTYLLIQATTLAGLVLAIVAPQAWPGLRVPGPVGLLIAVGLAIGWSGIALRVWSVLTLGRSFQRVVTVADDQAVVSSGPYRFVRHPSYTGVLLGFLGVGVLIANWGSVVALAVLPTIGYVRRIRVEEEALRGSLGDDYAVYARGKARLVPGIW